MWPCGLVLFAYLVTLRNSYIPLPNFPFGGASDYISGDSFDTFVQKFNQHKTVKRFISIYLFIC